jgi:hypothetical protein
MATAIERFPQIVSEINPMPSSPKPHDTVKMPFMTHRSPIVLQAFSRAASAVQGSNELQTGN